MKLVVGMGTIDDYPALVEAGADGVFCGYIPAQWGMQYGDQTPMNRREVLYPNVQIGSESELAILADMQTKLKVPVTLTLNAPCYTPETLNFLQGYVQRCSNMGFQNFIIADEHLIQILNQVSESEDKNLIQTLNQVSEIEDKNPIRTLNQVSEIEDKNPIRTLNQVSEIEDKNPIRTLKLISETVNINPSSHQNRDEKYDHSKNSRQHISNKKKSIHLSGEYGELNRLVLEELNQYTQLERIIFPRQTTIAEMKRMIPHSKANTFEAFFLNEKCHFTGAYCNSIHSDFFCHMCQVQYRMEAVQNDLSIDHVACESNQTKSMNSEEIPNSSGCGYCALWKLREAGITHLKIVSRGNYVENTIEDVKRAKKALDILEASDSEREYIQNMKEALFPKGCSGNCYYL